MRPLDFVFRGKTCWELKGFRPDELKELLPMVMFR